MFSENMSKQIWLHLCDLFVDNAYQLRCVINKENRTKKSIDHYTCSRSFVAARESKHKEDGAELGRIEFYKITRFKNGKWISNEAEERYENMVAMMNNPDSTVSVDEIADEVLG